MTISWCKRGNFSGKFRNLDVNHIIKVNRGKPPDEGEHLI